MITSQPRILCVDDDPELLSITSEILRMEGYEVIEASTGNECLRIANKERPDLILLDVNLPDINGIEVCKQIKADAALIGMYVMLISGTETSSGRQVDGLEAGADGYIARPISNHELLARVQAILRLKKSENELRKNEEKYRILAESAQDHIYVIDENCRVQYCNLYGINFFARSNKVDIIGKSLDELFGPEVGEKFKQSIKLVFSTGKPLHETNDIEFAHQRIWLDARLTPLKNAEGKVLNVMGISRDFTEIKRAEEALKKALVEAEVANRAKSDFLANMSHEITTPLNSIVGFSQILQDGLYGELNEKQKEYVSDVLSSGQHLLALITDMLDLSRATSGDMELKLSRFLVKDVLRSSITVFNEEAMKHNLNLSLDLAPEADREIEADSGMFHQVMFNLLSNAVKFTPDRGSVRVAARRVKSSELGVRSNAPQPPLKLRGGEEELIEISVSDTGIGIKPDDLTRLFKDIAQFEAPYTKKYSGTGIGLMLTEKLIELHGGRIWAESEFGKGSTFTFTIPCKGKQPSEQIIDPVTKLLTWEHFLKHISRVLSFHKRKGRHFGLLRIELGNITKPEEHLSIIEILRGLVRQHEILSKSRDGFYYLITFEADRKVVGDTVLRITTALKENGYKPVIKTAVYMEDGENIKDLLEALNI